MARYLLDTIQVQATAPGAVAAGAANNGVFQGGDSATVRDAQQVYLLPAFGHNQVAGAYQVKAGSMHDAVNGIRKWNIAAQPYPLWPAVAPLQRVGHVDTLGFLIGGSAVGGQIETMLQPVLYVEPSQQNAATLLDGSGLRARGTGQYTTVQLTLIQGGGFAGGYAQPTLLNAAANIQNLIGGRQYVVLGASVDTVCAGITLRGPGTGSARIAIPGHPTDKDATENYLLYTSLTTGMPLMPVISQLDAGQTTVEVVCNQAGGTFIINLSLMLLN